MTSKLLLSAFRGSAAPFVLAAAVLAPSMANAQNAGDAVVEEDIIIVTGSRIVRPELELANPVVSVSEATIQRSGTTNLTDFLTDVPALIGSSGSNDNSGSGAGIGATGLNLLDLRNLGVDRTLVLVDGRRHVGSFAGSQAVDINLIPNALIERVDVLTGGASAIYGADGVTGVVNFVMKRNFEGLAVDGQAGISEYGDAGQKQLSVTVGRNFGGGRGNVAFAYMYGKEDRLESRDRSRLSLNRFPRFLANPDDTEGPGQSFDGIPDNLPYTNTRYYDTSRAGGIDVDLDGMPDFYGADGAVFDPGQYLSAGIATGGTGTPVSDYANDLLPRNERHIANLFAHYEFSPSFELYGEAKYARTKSYSLGQPTFDYYLLVGADNPYLPASVLPFVDPDAGVMVNRDNFDLGQRGEDIKRETVRTVIGARGEITSSISYDVSYVFGQTKVTNHYINDIYDDRFFAAIDAVADPVTGNPTCRVNLDPSWTPNQPYVEFYPVRDVIPPTTFAPGECVPFNLFGDGVASQAAMDWLRVDTTDRSKLQQHVFSAAISGTIDGIEAPGGPIGFAIGGEYRKEKSSFVSDPIARQGLTFTNAIAPTRGNFDVYEVFGELNIPVLRDVPFAYHLDIGGAIRYSDYSTIGSTTAWKVDASYAPVRDITVRGTYSKAVRAPNIGELFDAGGDTFEFIDDPCDLNYLQNGTSYRAANCATLLSDLGVTDPTTFEDTRSVNIPGFQGGNADLEEEKATTWTAGVVLQPRFIPGLVFTADWYDIKLKNAINQVDAEDLAELCVDAPTLDNQYCAAITRTNGGAQAGYISGFVVQPLNVANFKTSGLDMALDYTLRTDARGDFNVRVVGNYLNHLSFVPIPGADPINERETFDLPAPKFQASADLTWAYQGFTVNYGLSWFDNTYRYDRQTVATNPDVVAPQYMKYKERWVHDVFMSYDVDERFQIYGGVNNFTGERPGFASTGYPVSAVGRFFYMGFKVKTANLF